MYSLFKLGGKDTNLILIDNNLAEIFVFPKPF